MTDQEKIAATAKLYPLPLTALVTWLQYGVAKDGSVWIKRGEGALCTATAICSPFTVVKCFTYPNSDDTGIRVKVESIDGSSRTIDLPRATLQSRAKTLEKLLDIGLRLADGGDDVVMAVLRSANPPKPAPQPKPMTIREDAF
jgi:hypothetical protein